MTTERKLLILLCEYVVLVIASLTVPKFAAQGQEGLAAAGTAAFWFLIIAFFALILSVLALVTVLKAWKHLSVRYRITGMGPVVFSIVALLSVFLLIRHEISKEQQVPPAPATLPKSPSS